MSFPNQKKIIITRSTDKVLEDYLKVSNENLYLAMKDLKSTTFLLWIYLVDNANNFQLDLYPSDFIEKSGLSYKTYTRAFKELLEKEYLIQSEKNNKWYLFKEKSDLVKPQKTKQEQVKSLKEEYF